MTHMSQKRENLRFSTFLTLLRSYSIYVQLTDKKRAFLNQVSLCLGEKEISSCRLPFTVNAMLNLSIVWPLPHEWLHLYYRTFTTSQTS